MKKKLLLTASTMLLGFTLYTGVSYAQASEKETTLIGQIASIIETVVTGVENTKMQEVENSVNTQKETIYTELQTEVNANKTQATTEVETYIDSKKTAKDTELNELKDRLVQETRGKKDEAVTNAKIRIDAKFENMDDDVLQYLIDNIQ